MENGIVSRLTLSNFSSVGYFSDTTFSYDLQYLKLVNFGSGWPEEINRANCEHICELLLKSTTLETLHLKHFVTEEEDVKHIADALSTNSTLMTLSVDVRIGECQYLAQRLENNTTLTELNLNKIFYEIDSDNPWLLKLHYIMSRNRAVNTPLFNLLFHHALDVNDSDYDENGYFTKKHAIPLTASSSKRHHT